MVCPVKIITWSEHPCSLLSIVSISFILFYRLKSVKDQNFFAAKFKFLNNLDIYFQGSINDKHHEALEQCLLDTSKVTLELMTEVLTSQNKYCLTAGQFITHRAAN